MRDDLDRAQHAKKGSPFLNTAQAAFYIGLSFRTLEKMRLDGKGPRYRRHGRHVRYHIDDLDDWSARDPAMPSLSHPKRDRSQ